MQNDKFTFDVFEVNLQTEELWRGTHKVRCQRQPFRVLRTLLERPGEVVSREELQQAIWGIDSPADADHSLGIAINKLRESLGDSAESPRFIETLSRRGYRFVAPVTASQDLNSLALPEGPIVTIESAAGPASLDSGIVAEPALHIFPNGNIKSMPIKDSLLLLFGLLALLVLGSIACFALLHLTRSGATPRRIDQLTHNNSIFPGVPEMESFPVLVSDGSRLYSSVLDNGQTEIALIDAATGEMQRLELPSEIVNPTLGDISPDGSRLLIRSHLSSDSEEPVWVAPRNGGSALRVGRILAHDAAWMPDGQSILYADGNNLDVVRIADGVTTHLTVLPGRAIWMRWSPDGKLLRFTMVDPLSHTSSLWQIANGGKPQPILSGWTSPAAECCGMWAPDGRSYVFQSLHDGSSDLWRLRDKSTLRPEKLTNGPLRFVAPIVGRDSDRVYVVGLDVRSELQRFDQAQQHFVAERDFLSEASRVSYSRDRQWVAWIDEAQHLWRGRAVDGTEKIQLTPDNLRVFLAQWSPDGHHLLAMARESGRSWQIFLVDAEGGASVLLHENRNQADPTWSGDGKQIAFGRTTDLMGREDGTKQIEVLDLATRKNSVLPGSDGLFSPRWSPDGHWIAALTLGEQRLMLYNVATHTWRQLNDVRAADPVWTADSSALYIHAAFSKPQTIQRITVPTGNSSVVVTLANPLISDNADYVFVGITRDDSPLVRIRTSTGNLYTLLLDR